MVPIPAAAAAASSAFIVPLAMSASSIPAPTHPRVFLWYRSLRQPWFKPPDRVIPIAWTGIEACLATAAYQLLRTEPSPGQKRALGLLFWNIFMIGGWSRLFFKRRNLALSTIAASSMIVTGAEFVRQAKPVDRNAARAGIPFVAWVSFATILDGNDLALNRRR